MIKNRLAQPSIKFSNQYIKSLYFNNKNSAVSFSQLKEQPKLDVSIHLNHNNVRKNIHEVVLRIKIQAKPQNASDIDLFDIELSYAGLVTLSNIKTEEQKEKILMINAPTLLYPYARYILANISREGGLQSLILEPMDFDLIYQKSKNSIE